MRNIIAALAFTAALAACSAPAPVAPQPTPQVIEVPGPVVYQMPGACVDYIVALETVDQLRIDAFNELLNGGSPDVSEINRLTRELTDLVDACIAAAGLTPAGTSAPTS